MQERIVFGSGVASTVYLVSTGRTVHNIRFVISKKLFADNARASPINEALAASTCVAFLWISRPVLQASTTRIPGGIATAGTVHTLPAYPHTGRGFFEWWVKQIERKGAVAHFAASRNKKVLKSELCGRAIQSRFE
jgi:hypothetical protein